LLEVGGVRVRKVKPGEGQFSTYQSLASPFYTALALILTDLSTLTISLLLSVWLRHLLEPTLPLGNYLSLWPLGALFPSVYALVGLYGVGFPPPEELRRLSYVTTMVFAALGTATFLSKTGINYSRGVFFLAWGFTLVLVPLGRVLVRELCARRPWWGAPVVVLGAGKTGETVVRVLCKTPALGLKPVALLDDDPAKWGHSVEGVGVIGGLELGRELGLRRAIIAMPGVSREKLLSIVEQYGGIFSHLILIPDLFGFSSLWVSAKDLGGVLGLEVRQQLLLPGPRFVKRAMDVIVSLVGSLLISPLVLVIAVLIKLDSPGPVLYGHTRIGQDGRWFKAWKFRTMLRNADQVLKEHLEKHPELREEWERYQKLRNDPRVTRVGRLLRKTSLDELPQLWNVLRGEMSLVGPRPIAQDQIRKYGEKFALYARVKPGITGLWQVSGRNETTFEERVALDTYYVRNWSIWLDLYILARTVWVVISCKGAY